MGFAVDGGELFLGAWRMSRIILARWPMTMGAGRAFRRRWGLDGNRVVGFLDLVDGDGDGVGQFGLEADVDLGADDVGDEKGPGSSVSMSVGNSGSAAGIRSLIAAKSSGRPAPVAAETSNQRNGGGAKSGLRALFFSRTSAQAVS